MSQKLPARSETAPPPAGRSPAADADDLPEGWAVDALDGLVNLAGRIGWRGLTAAEYRDSGPVLLSVPNLNHGNEVDFTDVYHISKERYDESPEIMVQKDDILLTKDGAGIGKVGIVNHLPCPATVNSSLLVIRAKDAFDPRFLFYVLKGPDFQQLAQERITGSTTPHLFQKDIKTLQVSIAPLAEQRRIVGKLEAVLGKVSASRERLARVPGLLKRFRQSVLAAACSGKLTADWREGNPDAIPVTATKGIRKSSQSGRETELRIPGDYGLSVGDCGLDAPSKWAWSKLTEFATLESGHTPSRKHPEYWNGDIPWIGIRDAGQNNGCVIHRSIQQISALGLANSSTRLLPASTVCLTRTANSIGYSCILGREMATSQDLVGWICSEAIWPKFLMTLFLAENDALYRFARGSAHPTVYFPEILDPSPAIDRS